MARQAFEQFSFADNSNNQNSGTNLVDLMLFDRKSAQASPNPKPVNDESKPSSAPGEPAITPQVKPCPESPAYINYIDRVARNIYDPTVLGDLDKLKNKFNCIIEQSKNPFKYAKEALDTDDDPYTGLLTPDQYQKMQDAQRGTVVGAGVVLRMPTADEQRSGKPLPVIVQDFESTPLRTQQLKPGDEILSIGNTSVKGKDWREALGMLDGPENSEVYVRVLRDGQETTINLKRTKEEAAAVETKMVDGDQFAHVRMRTFMQSDTSEELERAILDNPNAKGYILDLRHNPGGLLDEAFTSASVFLNEGKILSIRSRVPSDPANPQHQVDTYTLSKDHIQKIQDGGQPVNYMARHEDRVHKPVVVLTDQGTASAAEILAGALKDTDGAYVIGTPTWGKGLGQTIMPDYPTGGATKVTTFHYFTPNGTWPGDGHNNRIGLQPNMLVPNPRPSEYGTAQDGQMNAAIEYLRKSIVPPNVKP